MAAKRGKARRVPWVTERWRRLGTPVVRVGSGLVVLVCLGVVASHLASLAVADRRFTVDPACVLDESVPPWLPESIALRIREDLAAAEPVSIFADDFAAQLRSEVVDCSPWIADVRGVERLFPNRARVELILRKPVVSVEGPTSRFLIDGGGLVIHEEPRNCPTRFASRVLPVEGARPATPPAVGHLCDDSEVIAAIQVAREIQKLELSQREVLRQIEPFVLAVRHSVRGAIAARGEVHLVTSRGVFVEWGRAKQSAYFGLTDIPVARKITNLQWVLEKYPGLEGLEEARLNFEQAGWREIGGPLTFGRRPDPVAESGSDS